MQLFEEGKTKEDVALKKKYKKIELKKCCKCKKEHSNTIMYTEKEIICMECYCELIAKDRRVR